VCKQKALEFYFERQKALELNKGKVLKLKERKRNKEGWSNEGATVMGHELWI
jgi:hypothetical protein